MRAVLLFAHSDPFIMPLNRYRSSREAVSAVLAKYKDFGFARAVRALQAEARDAWKAAVQDEMQELVACYVQHRVASGLAVPEDISRRACVDVHDMHIGMYDRLGVECTVCLHRKKCVGYHFCNGSTLCNACCKAVADGPLCGGKGASCQ